MHGVKLGLLAAIIAVFILLMIINSQYDIDLTKAQNFIKSLGVFAPIAFLLVFTLAPVVFIPIIPLSITGGILFGPLMGTIYTVIGSTLGASAAFMVSRYIAKDWIDQKSHTTVKMVQTRIKDHGWKFIALSRINPLFPFNLQNYAFGITEIPFKTFFITTLLSMIPGAIAYVYLGYTGLQILADGYSIFIKIAVSLLFIILVGMIPYYIIKNTAHNKA